MTIRQVIEQIQYIKTIVKNLISSVAITETAPMPLVRINYYLCREDEKAGSGIGKVCFRGIGWSLCILI